MNSVFEWIEWFVNSRREIVPKNHLKLEKEIMEYVNRRADEEQTQQQRVSSPPIPIYKKGERSRRNTCDDDTSKKPNLETRKRSVSDFFVLQFPFDENKFNLSKEIIERSDFKSLQNEKENKCKDGEESLAKRSLLNYLESNEKY